MDAADDQEAVNAVNVLTHYRIQGQFPELYPDARWSTSTLRSA